VPAAPGPETIAQARAAAQAALTGKPASTRDQAPPSGVSSATARTRSQTNADASTERVVPSPPKSPGAMSAIAVPRPRPMSMYASTEMQSDAPDEVTLMPPPISAVMSMEQNGLSPASSMDTSLRGAPYIRAGPTPFGIDPRNAAMTSRQASHRSRSNSEAHGRASQFSRTSGAGGSHHDGGRRRGRLPEIPPILPVNSKTGEELGIGVGAGIASHVPRHIEDVLFPDSPTPQSPRLTSSSGAASRMKSWFNRRASRWGAPGLDQPVSIGSVLTADRRDQPEILQHMRVHRGVIDPDALSELPPDVLFSRVLQNLDELGFTVLKTEGLKIRVLRPHRQGEPSADPDARTRTMSTNVDAAGDSFSVPEPPRRQSVPTVRHSPVERHAAKRATIMDPGCPDFDLRQAAPAAPEKMERRPHKLGTALMSVRRFFGGSPHKRWLGVSWASGSSAHSGARDSAPDSALASTETANGKPRPSYSRRESTASTNLGIVGSPGAGPHRRSMSESPGLSAKCIGDQVGAAAGSNGLAAVPEESEPLPATVGRAGKTAADPSQPAKPATAGSVRSGFSGSIAPLQHSVDIEVSPAPAAADSPFSNPFQAPGVQAPYGSSQVDNGDEVQLTIEVCKIKNLSNFFIVHVSRRKGNVWAYKHLYHLIIESLALRSDDARRYAPKLQ
ncbi:hypothetical protein H4R19_005329, partial [Coemansia spiralis]